MRNTKLFKFIMMFVLLCTASAAAASTASAWTTNGRLAFTATTGPALLVINSSPTVGVNCTGTPAPGNTASGVLRTSAEATNAPYTGLLVGPGGVNPGGLNLTWSGCTAAGFAANVSCVQNTTQLWGTSYSTTPAPGVTSGEVRNINCTILVPSLGSCAITVTGTGPNNRGVLGSYTNPNTGTATPGRLGVSITGQTLTASWNSACTIFSVRPGTASARISNKQNTDLQYTVTAPSAIASQPFVTNP